MSRIGKKPIEIPSGVTIDVKDNLVTVKGPKGEDSQLVSKNLKLEQEENELCVMTSENPTKIENQEHGLYRSLIANMVLGVT